MSLPSLSDLHNSELDVKLESLPSIKPTTELDKCKEELNIQKIRVEDLKREIGRLIREQEQTFEQYTKEVKELKRRWNRKEDECKGLIQRIEEIKVSYDGKIEEVIKDKDEEISNLKERLFITDKDTKKQIDSLTQELGTLKSFIKREKEYQDTIKKLNGDLEKNRIERNELMSKIHLLRVRVNALERENEMSKKKLSETKSELDRSMDVSRNLRMDSEHDDKPHKPGYDPLEKTTLTKLKDRRKAASLNKTRDNSGGAHERSFTNVKNQVSEGEFNEVHTINVRQANKIKNLKTKNQELKVNLQNEQNLHAKEKERIQYQLLVKIKRLESTLERIEAENALLHGENKTLKNIAQVILDKRSEVEQFLLEAINEVKSNSKKDMLNNTKNTIRSAPTNRLESVRKYSNIEEKKFEELSWDEKEHVLRELFAKVQKGNLKKNQEFIEEVMTFAKN